MGRGRVNAPMLSPLGPCGRREEVGFGGKIIGTEMVAGTFKTTTSLTMIGLYCIALRVTVS